MINGRKKSHHHLYGQTEPAKMPYHAGHPLTKEEASVVRWAAPTVARNYTRKSPKLTEIKEGDDNTLALTLCRDLAMKIQQALCLGRQHRLSAQFTKAKLKELKTERLDNAGLAEILEFELQLKKRELEQALVPSDQQREELRILAKDFHRMRNNKDVIERNLVILDEGDKKEIERWRDAWFEVDKLLDTVWMEAGILKQYENTGENRTGRPAATFGNRTNDEQGQTHGDGTNGRSCGERRDRPRSRRRESTEAATRRRDRHADRTWMVYDSDRSDERDNSSDQVEENRRRSGPTVERRREERLARPESERGRRSSPRLRSREAVDRRGETGQRRRDSPRLRSQSRSRSGSPSLDQNRERRERGRRNSRVGLERGEYRDRDGVIRRYPR